MRRTRIKGVANIPQRKKNDIPNKSEEESAEKIKIPPEVKNYDIPNKCTEKTEKAQILLEVEKKQIIEDAKVQDYKKQNSLTELIKPSKILDKEKESSKLHNVITEEITDKKIVSIIDKDCSTDRKSTKNSCITKKQSVPFRRKLLKPSVSLNGLSRKIPVVENNEKEKEHTENVEKLDKLIDSDEDPGVHEQRRVIKIEQNILLHPPSSPLSKCSNQPGISKLNVPTDLTIVNNTTSSQTTTKSDLEYQLPPASPNKINRSRIKAVPRIGYRKISFSASESEDDSKRTGSRSRHDSQSSNISVVQDAPIEMSVTQKPKEFSSVIQRKCKRTEWSRKLAEARREFTRKFMFTKPDHKKLTMIDLIFYNPATNSMKKENCKESEHNTNINSTNEEEIDDPVEIEEEAPTKNYPEEKSEDPQKDPSEEKSHTSEEENEIPAPQIKIGPSGELILDEKSLVIENKETKKKKEELRKSKIIDGNSDRPYGVFKKVKRSKDWSHAETLRFYRALSRIGTDFSLMCELFPNRSRRELKMKFKKEERMNQALIDKAMMEPCSFDFEELKKEFELVELERKELEQQKIDGNKLKKNRQNKRSVKLINLTRDFGNQGDRNEVSDSDGKSDDDDDCQIIETEPIKKRNTNFMKKFRQKKLDIMDVLSDSDSADSDLDEPEALWQVTRTRCGRKVRKREIYDPGFAFDEDSIIPRKILKPQVNTVSSQQPGQIMMVASETADGQPIVKIFMVGDKNSGKKNGMTEDGKSDHLIPVAVIQSNATDEEEEEEIVENNYTIPADPTDSPAEPSDARVEPSDAPVEPSDAPVDRADAPIIDIPDAPSDPPDDPEDDIKPKIEI